MVTGVVAALFGGFLPVVSLAVLLCLVAASTSQAVFGITGSLVVVAAVLSFFLMNRFDEGLALAVGGVKMKATFWFTLLCVAALAVRVGLLRGDSSRRAVAVEQPRKWLTSCWVLFAGLGVLSIGLNHTIDRHVTGRYLPGELLALLAICTPVAFAVLIPLSNLTRARTLLCLRVLVLLGGLSGFIMAAFGLLPGRLLALLGWTGATGGTLDLIRGRLPMGHANTVAAVMLLLMPPALMGGLVGRNGAWRLVHLGCAALMFCGVLFSLSRSALLCMVLIVAATFAQFFLTQKAWRRAAALLISVFLGLGLIGTAGYLFSRYDFSRFWSRGYFEDASVERRANSMLTALAVWRDHPVLGAGPDSVYPRFELRPGWTPPTADQIGPVVYYRGRITAADPHNLYLDLLAEFGVLGSAAFAGILFSAMVALFEAWRHPRADEFERRTLAALMLGIVAFLMIGMFASVLITTLRANVVFWIFVGLSLRFAVLATRSQAPT